MELLHVALTSIGSVIAIFLLTKLLGNRQMSQLTMFDYVTGITIGSIAAEMATALEDDFMKPLLAMIIYAGIAVCLSLGTVKSIKMRKWVTGQPVILYENGKLYEKNLKSIKLDINEFLTECRTSGYFDLTDVQSAVFETNGKISFLPTSQARPVTPEDLTLTPTANDLVYDVVIDGHIMPKVLKSSGNNEEWLRKELAKQHCDDLSEILLATCDTTCTLTIYKKQGKKFERPFFE